MKALTVPVDRHLSVNTDHVIRTGYIHIDRVCILNRSRIAVGDIDPPYRKRLCLGSAQPYPSPYGEFRTDSTGATFFYVIDGRHEYIAALCLGYEYILVAWEQRVGETPAVLQPLLDAGLLRI